MNKVRVYNFSTLLYDDYIGEFEQGGQLLFDFPPTNHFDASGNVKFIAQRLVDGSWVDISSTTAATINESKSTDGVIQIDENGFKAFKASDPSHPSVDINSTGNLTITGVINATSGTIGNWNIVGSILKSTDNTISLDGTLNTITVGTTADNVVLSTANGIVAKKGTIGGWSINATSLYATNMTLTGGATPQITIGSNITITPTLLTVNNGAINITTGPSNAVTINSTGIKAMSGANYAQLDNTGLKIVGGAISIETNVVSATKKLVINSTGIIAYKDATNRVELDSDGVRCIKAGNVLGSAITADGIIGTLITNQSIPGSKFDITPPAQPTIVTGAGNTYAYVEQTATSEFVNIRVKFNAVADTDREGYKIYIKEGIISDATKLYMPVAVLAKGNEAAAVVIYDIRNVKSNTIYSIKVTAYDVTGNESALSGAVAVEIAGIKDLLCPKPTSAITVLPGFKMIAVRWVSVLLNTDNSACVDLDYYLVEKSINLGAWAPIAKVYTDMIIDKDVNYDTSYRYQVKAVDLSGNASTYVISETVTASRIDRGDIVAKSITTELLKIGSIVKSINREETTLFHFDGTLMSTQGLTPFIDADKVIHQQGFFKKEAKFGASLSIEEDTTNLVAIATDENANLKGTATGWIVGTGATYITSNGVEGIDDGYLEIPYNRETYVNLTVIPGKTYAVSIYAKQVDTNSVVRVDIDRLNGTTTGWGINGTAVSWTEPYLKQVISSAVTQDWKRYYGWFTVPLASGTTSIRITPFQLSGAGKVAVDSLQVEERAYSTSFVNGVKTEGYVDYYAAQILNPIAGVIAFWTSNIIGWHNAVDNDHPDDSPLVDNWFIWGREDEANKIYAKYNRGTSTCTFMYGNTSLTYVFPAGILNTDWIHVAYSWESGLQKLYINGLPVATSTGTAIGQPTDSLFRLGYFPRRSGATIIEESDPNAMNKRARASMMFDEFRIDRVKGDVDEIQSWFNQASSFYDASAQIDADSQNISAANAAVTINNEGITVRDGKIAIESEDGKILLRDGRIQVNGLDVGVAQSENAIFNGNFTISDMGESVGDVYLSEKGITKTGAKYWNVARSSGPLFSDIVTSVGWQYVSPTDYLDSSVIKALYTSSVKPTIIGMAKATTYTTYIRDMITATLTPYGPAAPQMTACQSAANTVTNLYIDNYSTDIGVQVATILTPQAATFGGTLATYIALTAGVIIGSKPFIQMSVEAGIDNQVNGMYANLMSKRYGYASFNDSTGVIQSKVYQIFPDETLHEVAIDLSNPDMPFTMDGATGLPVVSATAYTGGNTSFYVHPENKVYGRQGISELSVRGSAAESVVMSQPTSNLVTYTDGPQQRGVNFKQHTFSFNGVWKETLEHEKIIGTTGKFSIEVEELVPVKPLDRNPVTGVIPLLGTAPYTIPQRKATYDYDAISGKYNPSPSVEFITLNPLTQMPTDNAYIAINTLGLGQNVTLGNTEITYDEGGNVIGYSIRTIKDMMTITVWAQGKGVYPNGVPYTHIAWGDGMVFEDTLYIGKSVVTAGDKLFAPKFTVKTLNTPNHGTQHTLNTTSAGDFIGLAFGVYTKCDISFSVIQDPLGGRVFLTLDDKIYGLSDTSFITQTVTSLTMTDFTAGSHQFSVVNAGLPGLNTGAGVTNPGLSVISAEIYDWTKLIMPDDNVKNKVEFYTDGNGKDIIAQPGTDLTTGAKLYEDGRWNTTYISPNYANSLNTDGSPLFSEMIPIKYKVVMKLSKQAGDSEASTILLSGMQAELGTNPSYTRQNFSKYSMGGNMIQPYSSAMWVESGIQTKHLEVFREGFPAETGIQSRHISDRQIISTKIAKSTVINEHIARSNITFDKTRIRKQKITSRLLLVSDYSIMTDPNTYVSLQASSIPATDFSVPAPIQTQSEFVIKNGQILDDIDDYSMMKHIAFVNAKDTYDVAVAYGLAGLGTTERVLTPTEFGTLIATVQGTDLYLQPVLYNVLKGFDVLFYTRVRMIAPIETINSYTDKIKIQFWEEL